MDDEGKYEGVAQFCWLVSLCIGVGTGLMAGPGWGLVSFAMSMVVVVTGTASIIYLAEKSEKEKK